MRTIKKFANIFLFIIYLLFFYRLAMYGVLYAMFEYQVRISGYVPAFFVAIATVGTFSLLHFRVFNHFPLPTRLQIQARIAKLLSIFFFIVFGFFAFLNYGSLWLYQVNDCAGGLGSGVRCPSGPEELISSLTAINTILAFIGFGGMVATFLALGAIFALKWLWYRRKASRATG